MQRYSSLGHQHAALEADEASDITVVVIVVVIGTYCLEGIKSVFACMSAE